MNELLFTDLKHDVLELDGLVAGCSTSRRRGNCKQFLQSGRVGGVSKEGAFALDFNQAFILQLVEMVGERGVGDFEFTLNLADDQAFRMGGEQQLHDAESRLGSHGGKHIGVFGDAFAGLVDRGR